MNKIAVKLLINKYDNQRNKNIKFFKYKYK